MKTRDKLTALRALLKKRGLAAYLIPSTDPHQSEYVPACWQRRAWFSGFTGSAGEVVVTTDKAGLWTDGRYFLQAANQLRGSGIKLYRMNMPGVPSVDQFLAANLGPGDKVGVDPRLLSLAQAQRLEKTIAARGAKLTLVSSNLVDRLWRGRPRRPTDPVRILRNRYCGETVAAKLKRIRKQMKRRGADAHVLTTLDAIAWVFNVRGTDVEFNPVVISYGLITAEQAFWFVDPRKVPPQVAKKLAPQVLIRPYGDVRAAMRELVGQKARVWLDAETTNRWIAGSLKGCELVKVPSPIGVMKAKKNAAEIAGMSAAHVRDGVAMVRFLYWLDSTVGQEPITELSAEAQLEQFRSIGEGYQGPSFHTISAFAGHGAIIHYAADEQSNATLDRGGIYLVDSGGQYLDGTTDITRTVSLGAKPTAEQKKRFTLVLKGHIDLATARFPEGVRGLRLDTLARFPLWQAGLDYNHGTGHGVGAYLNVHEGPQSISPTRCTGIPLEEGNVQSNEPGFYEPDGYGIRIESLVLVQKDEKLCTKEKTWLRFETLTLCPIDTRLVNASLLSEAERKWLNAYHRRVKKTLSPLIHDAACRKWLTQACKAI